MICLGGRGRLRGAGRGGRRLGGAGGGRGPVVSVQQFEVGEGDALGVNGTISPAARHTVQPAHVNTSTSPQRAGPNHPIVGLGHPSSVVSVSADLKLKLVPCGGDWSDWSPHHPVLY